MVTTRKEGNQVFYALRDPLLIEVLGTMRRYFQAHFEESLAGDANIVPDVEAAIERAKALA